MNTYQALLDQIVPYLECQFIELPTELQNRLTQKEIAEPIADISAKVNKWNELSKLQREYLAALYDYHYVPSHKINAAKNSIAVSIKTHLNSQFSELPPKMKMNIACIDNFGLWNEISMEQREYLAQLFDDRMQLDYEEIVNHYCNHQIKKEIKLDDISREITEWKQTDDAKDPLKLKVKKDEIKILENLREEINKEHLPPYPYMNTLPRSNEVSKSDIPSNKLENGITKKEVMSAFHGLHFNSTQWSKNLSSPPQWLIGCRVLKGARGNNRESALWNPVKIALALYDKGISIDKLDAVFRRLKDWDAEWEDESDLLR